MYHCNKNIIPFFFPEEEGDRGVKSLVWYTAMISAAFFPILVHSSKGCTSHMAQSILVISGALKRKSLNVCANPLGTQGGFASLQHFFSAVSLTFVLHVFIIGIVHRNVLSLLSWYELYYQRAYPKKFASSLSVRDICSSCATAALTSNMVIVIPGLPIALRKQTQLKKKFILLGSICNSCFIETSWWLVTHWHVRMKDQQGGDASDCSEARCGGGASSVRLPHTTRYEI